MNTEVVITLTETFEGHAQQTDTGVEYWLARDLQCLLGYKEWRTFTAVIDKAKQPAKSRIIKSETILPTSGK